MHAPPPCPVAVLVVRAWHEDDSVDALRARITSTLDVSRADEVASAAATPEEVCATVRAWLEAFMAGRSPSS